MTRRKATGRSRKRRLKPAAGRPRKAKSPDLPQAARAGTVRMLLRACPEQPGATLAEAVARIRQAMPETPGAPAGRYALPPAHPSPARLLSLSRALLANVPATPSEPGSAARRLKGDRNVQDR